MDTSRKTSFGSKAPKDVLEHLGELCLIWQTFECPSAVYKGIVHMKSIKSALAWEEAGGTKEGIGLATVMQWFGVQSWKMIPFQYAITSALQLCCVICILSFIKHFKLKKGVQTLLNKIWLFSLGGGPWINLFVTLIYRSSPSILTLTAVRHHVLGTIVTDKLMDVTITIK